MQDRLIKVGLITSSHGVKGLLKVKVFAESPLQLFSSSKVFDESGRELLFEPKFPKGMDFIVAAINNISKKDDAEQFRGKYIYIKRSELPTLSVNEFYHEDLIGLKVLYQDRSVAGIVKSVANFGASDLLEIQSDSSDFFYPFHKDFVVDVSIKDSIIVIKKLEDLQ